MDKHTKILYGLIIVGFLSLSAQLWLQTQAINDLNIKMESVRELLYRFAWLFCLKKHTNFWPYSVENFCYLNRLVSYLWEIGTKEAAIGRRTQVV